MLERSAAQNQLNKEAQDIFAANHKSLRYTHTLTAEQLRGQVVVTTKVFETSVMRLKSYEDARVRYETSLTSLNAQEQDYQTKIAATFAEMTSTVNDIECYEELKRATKSYLSCSFDEALDTISESATRLVRSIPNMANATVQLMGVWETKEGKVKEEVNAVMHLDGDENVDIRSFCGGERSAIDLAVDLSVIELIENKTNKGINCFILDEPFTGLDTVCIEMALEVLKNSNSTKKLIIVDHNPEVKQMVESHILVVRDGLTSQVVQN
jgi:DNA repair exonuclease SbcCD ATPase subunit